MQTEYPKKLSPTYWDPVHIIYPVRKFPETGVTSEEMGRQWRCQTEILKDLREPINELKEYLRDYNITKELTRSQTTEDYGFKLPETTRFNKHTSCTDNHYIYPPSRRIADRPPRCTAYIETEMQSKYRTPITPSRLVTEKNHFKHPGSYPLDLVPVEPDLHKVLEPLDTTYDGYEKYLDPYLTTSKLHHRPYTADQLDRLSCSKDVVTYYTFADIPWVRTPKPKEDEWRLPLSRPKSMYDREKFNEDFREIRIHNKLKWVPGTFRTETRDNYIAQTSRPESRVHDHEEEIRGFYRRSVANLQTNVQPEQSTVQSKYCTENSQYGSRKPICSALDQYVEKNKRLARKSMHI